MHKSDEVDRQVNDMLEQGVISPLVSPYCFPVLLTLKADFTYSFCIYYRKLNEVVKHDSYPLARIDDRLDALAGSVYISTVNMASGYWQTEVHPDSREKTAFSTMKGLYGFNTLPFGLTNAPGFCQRLMEKLLAGFQWEISLIYLDDVIIFSKTH